MVISEIIKIKPDAYGMGDADEKLADAPVPDAKAMAKMKPLPGVDSRYHYVIYGALGGMLLTAMPGLAVKVIDTMDDNKLVASLFLAGEPSAEEEWDEIAPGKVKKYISSTVAVASKHQGKGLAGAMYAAAINDKKILIRADNRQTPAARALWISLSKSPELSVFGVAILYKYDYDDYEYRKLQQEFKKQGLTYWGIKGSYSYWIFPVRENVTKRELEFALKGSGVKLYRDVSTGLVAAPQGFLASLSKK